MKPRQKPRGWTISGLRTRYSPRSRIGQGLLSICPWLDIVLLFLYFVLLDGRLVLQPGVVIDLPESPFTEGAQSGFVVVVLSVRGSAPGPDEDIVFFDDERFRVRQKEQVAALKQAFAARVKRHGDSILIIQADRGVPHGTVMDIMNMALEVGVKRANVATRPF